MDAPDRPEFAAAVEELSLAHERETSLCGPFLRVLPITGAAISTIGVPFGSETVCASDARAARLDELQFDLGEGPSWDSLSTRNPVLVSDIRSAARPAWPALLKAIGDLEVRAVYAFPMVVGSLNIGAVDLYSMNPGGLTEAQVLDAVTLAGVAARQVLRRALSAQAQQSNPGDDDGHSRRVVHQATGIVLAQLDVSATDALLIIHGHAFSNGRTVKDVAADVVTRRLDFSSLLES